MNILFLNSGISNYVVDGLFYGLRTIEGVEVVDVPRMDVMYNDACPILLNKTGNRGVTLYGLLEDGNKRVKEKRYGWREELHLYDFIIISDIFLLADLYIELKNISFLKKKLVIIDGQDQPSLFPFTGRRKERLLNHPWKYLYDYTNVPYFKREFESYASWYRLKNLKILNKLIPSKPNIFPISMSLPSLYIKKNTIEQKVKQFVSYNVDPDLNNLFNSFVSVGEWRPTHTTAKQYLSDLDDSMYGITIKRAGWDCLRHYEYAARGSVLCFKNLDQKHINCAPYGLDSSNTIIYKNEKDLLNKIDGLSTDQYTELQTNLYTWINDYTSENAAKRFLNVLTIL